MLAVTDPNQVEMVRSSYSDGAPVGVVYQGPGGLARVGCLARVKALTHTEEGVLVLALGWLPFRVQETGQAAELEIGDVPPEQTWVRGEMLTECEEKGVDPEALSTMGEEGYSYLLADRLLASDTFRGNSLRLDVLEERDESERISSLRASMRAQVTTR